MFEIYENNAGYYNLAWLENGVCTYYLSSHKTTGLVQETVAAIAAGGDPIRDGYDGGEDDPNELYLEVVAYLQSGNGGVYELDATEMEVVE